MIIACQRSVQVPQRASKGRTEEEHQGLDRGVVSMKESDQKERVFDVLRNLV